VPDQSWRLRLNKSVLSVVLLLVASFGFSSGASGQTPGRITPGAAPACSDVRKTCIINPVFATGMKCDGVTDDSSALQAALNSAMASLGNATVIMPPGTCIIDPGAGVSINGSIWLQGAGKFGTTLKRKDSSAGASILFLNSNGVTLSNFAINGNKGGTGVATPTDSVLAGPISDITIERMRFVNSTNSDIMTNVSGAGLYSADWVIADNEFDNQGNPVASCVDSAGCANVYLHQPLRVRVVGNRSDNSQNFAIFSSIPGGGQVEIANNSVVNFEGFGIALGGGVFGASGAHIHHNFFSSSTTDKGNLVDVAFWPDFTVDHNVLHHNSSIGFSDGIASACIGDYPPANQGTVDSNFCHIVPSTVNNTVGIAIGGSDVSITNNFVEGASTAGIGVIVGNQGPARGVRIIGNTTKNNNQANFGTHGGIELFLGPGGPNLAGLSDVIVQGNHSYDDQPTKTQAYGITVALVGQQTPIANVLIEGNDVTGNKIGGILNNASAPLSGFVIRNNTGHNPIGGITAPAFPASAAALINNTGYDATVYITTGTNPISIAIGDTTLAGLSIPGGGAVSGPIRLPANQTITLTYMPGGTPTWQWIAD
jgi:hypothetical protein